MELENVMAVYRQKLQNALNDCKIDGRVIDQITGTTIIRFIVELGIGVAGTTLIKREDDLSSILGFQDEVITSIIPSISRGVTCAVDIPNPVTRVVYLEEIENHHSFISSKSPTTFAVGLDIYGQPVVGSMKDMPHLLVGGTTGSGKSIFLNSMITSMVCNTCPDRLELILIDPKGNEFSNYNDIPHLVTPVIQDSKKAIRLLDTLIEYMDKRFEFLTEHGFKDITSFNESNTMTDSGNCLPTMVIIIDELADLMMASNKAVEIPISRIAGKARACGMHLVLATQRPDRNAKYHTIRNYAARYYVNIADNDNNRSNDHYTIDYDHRTLGNHHSAADYNHNDACDDYFAGYNDCAAANTRWSAMD
jgi:S-DNA-T family DNA segregation ATPase FtsK/SpoIIIE